MGSKWNMAKYYEQYYQNNNLSLSHPINSGNGGQPEYCPQHRAGAATVSAEVRHSIDLIQNNKLAEAIELLQGAVNKNNEDAEAWQYLGVALSRQGKIDDAVRAYEQ